MRFATVRDAKPSALCLTLCGVPKCETRACAEGCRPTLAAERAFLNRKTLAKTGKGDPRVSIGAYASLLFVLGMTDRLAELADARYDRIGLTLEEERLPKRVRMRKQERPGART